MTEPCPGRATLLITRTVEGTSTSVARERVLLRCTLSAGHSGPHHDAVRHERWETEGDRPATLLRQEDSGD